MKHTPFFNGKAGEYHEVGMGTRMTQLLRRHGWSRILRAMRKVSLANGTLSIIGDDPFSSVHPIAIGSVSSVFQFTHFQNFPDFPLFIYAKSLKFILPGK
jgi:hypothetical protein